MKLNETQLREKYKEFYGRNNGRMELLIKDNRIPMSVKQIIERRLNSNQKDWRNNYFDTCDAIFYGDNGKFKIVKNSKIPREMTKETKLENGAIKITKAQYNKIKSKEFDNETKKEIIWKYLLEELYEPYIKLLGFCPDFYFNDDDNKYCVRVAFVCGLGVRSRLFGSYNLDDVSGRFVGLVKELQE